MHASMFGAELLLRLHHLAAVLFLQFGVAIWTAAVAAVLFSVINVIKPN